MIRPRQGGSPLIFQEAPMETGKLSVSFLKKGLTLTLIFSLLTLTYLFFHSATPDTWRSIFYFNPETIFLLLILVIASWLVEALRVKLIAATLDEKIGFANILRINMSVFLPEILPLCQSVPPQVTSANCGSPGQGDRHRCHGWSLPPVFHDRRACRPLFRRRLLRTGD